MKWPYSYEQIDFACWRSQVLTVHICTYYNMLHLELSGTTGRDLATSSKAGGVGPPQREKVVGVFTAEKKIYIS